MLAVMATTSQNLTDCSTSGPLGLMLGLPLSQLLLNFTDHCHYHCNQ